MNQTTRWPLLRGRPMLADKIYTNLRAADIRRLLEYVVELTGIAVIYVGLAKLSLALASIHPSATPIWPPTGYALAVVLLRGYRVSPAIFLGALVANVTTAGSVGTSLAIAIGNTLESLVGAYLINRWSDGRVRTRPSSSRLGFVKRHPRRWSAQTRCASTRDRLCSAFTWATPLLSASIIHSWRRSRLAALNPRAACTRLPNSSSLNPAGPALRTAARIAPRSRATKRKSLKWPACNAASCRLSVKPRSLRLCGGKELACIFIQRTALETSRVVAELRPSAERAASLLISRAWPAGWCLQAGQNRNLPGRNQARRPVEPMVPAASTVSGSGTYALRSRRRRGEPPRSSSSQSSVKSSSSPLKANSASFSGSGIR